MQHKSREDTHTHTLSLSLSHSQTHKQTQLINNKNVGIVNTTIKFTFSLVMEIITNA
jgi:hypothetical protein